MKEDHPDIICAMRTGYAPGQSEENQDTEESRVEFAEDNPSDFIKFVLEYDKSILDDYIKNRAWKYESWLN